MNSADVPFSPAGGCESSESTAYRRRTDMQHLDMDRTADCVAERLREAIDRECAGNGPDGIARAEIVIPRTDALAWFRAQEAHPVKVYWADREGRDEVAGVGVADVVASAAPDGIVSLFRQLRQRLERSGTSARYFGGMRFNGRGSQDAAWRHFGAYRFVLPRFELTVRGSESVLACQWLHSQTTADTLHGELATLEFGGGERGVDATATGRRCLPDRAGWDAAVSRTLELLSAGALDKLVLARKSTFSFTTALDPLGCLQALLPGAARCYRFCFIPATGRAFLGVSPERLYRRAGRRILCEAIAGTRSRGEGGCLDQQLERMLMGSDKERREHEFVVRGVRESFARLCRSLTGGTSPSVVKLWQCQHLVSQFEGVLHSGVSDADLVNALHPTPAVGGYRTDRAVRRIEETEIFDRGWYAGPVGWAGRDAAEFAVAIRSGFVEGATLSIFAGAGIVSGSEAESEWQELDCKTSHFTQALNLPP